MNWGYGAIRLDVISRPRGILLQLLMKTALCSGFTLLMLGVFAQLLFDEIQVAVSHVAGLVRVAGDDSLENPAVLRSQGGMILFPLAKTMDI